MARIDDSLDALYVVRSMMQDIYIPVLRKFPAGSAERNDFLAAKGSIDAAIVDLENAALGSIAKRMAEAKPDIKAATKSVKKHLEKLKTVQGASKKFTKILGYLEKAIGFIV